MINSATSHFCSIASQMNFHGIDQIHAVQVRCLPEVCNVFVFLEQDRYNEDLMDRLLDQEADILDLYPERLFHFYYLPIMKELA